MSLQPISILLSSDFTSPTYEYFLVLSFFALVLTFVLDFVTLCPYVCGSFPSLQKGEAVRRVRGRVSMGGGEREREGKGLRWRGGVRRRVGSLWKSSPASFPLASQSLGISYLPCIFWDTLAKGDLSQTLSLWFASSTHVPWHYDCLRHSTSILLFLTQIINCCLDLGPSPNTERKRSHLEDEWVNI